LVGLAEGVGGKNRSKDPPVQRQQRRGEGCRAEARRYNGTKERRGWGEPHPYNGGEKGEKTAGSATGAWEMLARASYVVNGNAGNDGFGALNGHREK
jgi:hypothetical protein